METGMGSVVGNEVYTYKSHKRRTLHTSVRHLIAVRNVCLVVFFYSGRPHIHYRVAPSEIYRFLCLFVGRNNI